MLTFANKHKTLNITEADGNVSFFRYVVMNPEGGMNPSNSCEIFHSKTEYVNLMVALEEKSRSPKSLGFILW